MRQRWIWGIAALWLVTGAALWTIGTPVSVMRRVAASLGRCASEAHAGETLKFHPVSAESAAQLQSARMSASHRSHRAESDSVAGVPPAPPAAETPPVPPTPPHAGELMRIGSDVTVERDQTVEGDVVAISGDVHVYGHVKGSVQALGGDVYLASTARVDGDVAAVRGELHEDPGAFVGGQRVTALSRPARVHEEARHIVDDLVSTHDRRWRHMMGFANSLVWLLVMLGLAWLILRIAEARTGEALSLLRRETAAALGIGLLTWVLIIPSLVALCLVIAVLCITIIGIPVALAALFAYGVILVVLVIWGFVIGATWLGRQIDRGPSGGSLLRHALLGTVAVLGARTVGHLLSVVPVFGFLGGFLRVISWIVGGILITLGAGALLRSEFASGLLGRWWRGWRTVPPTATAAAAASGGAVAPPPPATTAPAAGADPVALLPPSAPPAAGDPPASPPPPA